MGNLSTVSMMKQPLSEAQFAIKLYTNYFGPLPFKRLSLTQQTACEYGQSWPDWCGCLFVRSTMKPCVTLSDPRKVDGEAASGYWDVVTPHEVSHQWWGQLVGFGSYRDQWMSEGFADFSASLFLQSAYGKETATAAHPHHFRIGGGLIKKHQVSWVKHALCSHPAPTRPC